MHNNEIENLIHLHVDGAFSRRELIDRLVKYTGSVAAAVAAVESSGMLQAQTQACPAGVQVPEDAPGIHASTVTLHGEGGPLFAYLVLPTDLQLPRPAVLVIHENRGLNDHIKDVTRRVAKAGFVALGIDLLSRQGGTDRFTTPTDQTAAYNRTSVAERRQDMISAILTLKDQAYVVGDRLGAVGFCAGGANCIDLAINSRDLTASVVFYGNVPNPADPLQNISSAMLGLFGERDRNLNTGIPRLLTALQAGQRTYSMHIYEGANHAFHNDTGANYHAAAACDAWSQTIEFFGRHLDAPRV